MSIDELRKYKQNEPEVDRDDSSDSDQADAHLTRDYNQPQDNFTLAKRDGV